MTIAMVADIAVIVLIAVSFIRGMAKGFIKSVWRLAAWIISTVLTFSLLTPAYEFALTLPIREQLDMQINQYVCDKLSQNSDAEPITITGLPEFLEKNMDLVQFTELYKENVENAAVEISHSITEIIIKIAVFILLLLAVRVLLWIIFHILDIASKLPLIKGANKLLGGATGVISTMFIIYLVCAFISFFTSGDGVREVINSSYIVKYFYNNNILLQLAFGI